MLTTASRAFPETRNAGTPNIGRNGVIINRDNVTATGLFVEHFQQYNIIWNGQNGTTILYRERAAT